MCVCVCLCVYVKENKSSTLPDAVFFSGTEFWVLLFSCWLTCRIFSFDFTCGKCIHDPSDGYYKIL